MTTVIFSLGEQWEFYDKKKDEFSATAWRLAKESTENSPFAVARWTGEWHRSDRLWHIRKQFMWILANFSGGTDGVGTKVIPHASSWRQYIAAHDLWAMTLDDAIRNGDYPITFNNLLDARDIWEDMLGFITMLEELAKIADEQSVILYAGETANLGACISTPDEKSPSAFNWGSFIDSVKHPLIHGNKWNLTNFWKIEPGNVVVALKQWGFRSNGISAVRRAFEAEYGQDWYRTAPRDKFEDAFQASRIYCRAVGEAMGWFNTKLCWVNRTMKLDDFAFQVDIRWVAHLSGGSFEGKFFDALIKPNNVSAHLDNLYPTPDIVKDVFAWQQKLPEKLGRKSDVTNLNSVYKTFCAGQGMLVVVGSQEEAEKLIQILSRNRIESQIAGEITASKKNGPELEITGDQISLD